MSNYRVMTEKNRSPSTDGETVELTDITYGAKNNGQHVVKCGFDNNGGTGCTESEPRDSGDSCFDLPYRPGYGARSVNMRSSSALNSEQRFDSTLVHKRRRFMRSVRNKDLVSVNNELEEDPTLTMHTDETGVSALSQAVKGGPEVIAAFLKKIKGKRRLAIWIEHALLYAINEDNYESVEYLLGEREKIVNDHKDSKKKKGLTWSEKSASRAELDEFEDAEFPVYTTPIVLAAQLNRVDIVRLLNDRDVSEIHPLTREDLPDRCRPKGKEPETCEICRERRIFKTKRDVEESKRIIQVYKALSSPAYIFNADIEDPLLELFYLSREMQNLSVEDAAFKVEYEEICMKCRQFACDMLDLCRSTEEIETLMSATKGSEAVHQIPQNVDFQRILVAVTYRQKEFLTHPSCQQILQRKWFQGLPDWVIETEYRNIFFLLYLLLWFIAWPFACILFMIKLFPWVITFMKHPINKFISDTISFILFLFLLTLECTNNDQKQKASDYFTVIEILIILWIAGMLARQIKMVYRHRMLCCNDCSLATATREWRWYDMILLLFFVLWIIFHALGIAEMHFKGELHRHRQTWSEGNLILLSEGFFSLGTLLSFIKLVGLFKANSALGPLQISLKLMLNDILRFLLIFFITMTGFAMAITNIYSHYEDNVRWDKEGTKHQRNDLVNWQFAYKTLFWSLFGYGDVEVADVVVSNVNATVRAALMDETVMHMDHPPVVKHKISESFGYFLFGSYHIIVIIVLINMLIAMMARSYEVIESNSDREWKYARTKLRMLYFTEVGSLPPPFNIMVIGSIMKWLLRRFTKCCECCDRRYGTHETTKKHDYKTLMTKLSRRYMTRLMTSQKDKS